jgi:multiple sugar transport system substrate-binding protein
MNKKIGILAVSAALAVCLVLATGCSKPKAASGGTASASGAVTQKNISIWHYFDHEGIELERLAAEYSKLHAAEGVNITVTFMSREELMNQYTVGAVSGQLPDIGMVDSPDMASYISLGVFEDITDELKSWGQLDQFYPGPMSSTMDANGRIYGLPNNSNCLALACNMNLLEAAGLKKPTTWDELEAACAKLTNSSQQVYGFAMSMIPNEEGTFQIIPWLYAAGGSVADMDSPENIRAIDYLAGLVKKGYMSKEVVNWTQADAFNAFVASKAAMVESGTWQVADPLPNIKDFRVEYTLLPKDKKYASVIGGENFGVCTGTKYKEICVDFLEYMETAEGVAAWCEFSGKLPVRGDSVPLRDIWTKDPYISVFSDGMQYAVARGPHAEWPTISKAVYTAAQAAVLGQATAANALKAAAAVVDPILARAPIAQ